MNRQSCQRLRGSSSVLTANGGSSSIQFALFYVGESLHRIQEGGIDRNGLPVRDRFRDA